METPLQYHIAETIYISIIAALLPLAAFIVNFCLNKRSKASGVISTLAILISLVLSVIVFPRVWNQSVLHQKLLWFTIGSTKIYAGILLNNLSALMLVLVSAIALPVHVYSTAYMKHDEYYGRYFTYLSFFCFSMLALVIVDNLVLFYAFWELVGFSSYLLIGFWFTRDKAVQANKKAFIMNRIGDIGLLTAILIVFGASHTFDIEQLFGAKTSSFLAAFYQLPIAWQYVACGGLFLAVAAKSAQFPLHTWLPDAMEGPTSVSALIHAATMVAAGVFLLGRFYPLFNEQELTVLATMGCFTAFMAATIALTQNDFKRILAYSTISQLGYMVMAMGVGAYGSSLFHLATHAFFKCLLFLVAGIIIHEMQHIKEEYDLDIDPQNILYMGGLRKKMPFTFIACVVGGLALIGLPLTSGYLSKDGILIQAFEWSENKSWALKLIPLTALFTSWLTAFYVVRLIAKVFFGDFKLQQVNPHIKLHIKDGGWQYWLPLLFLALCSLFPIFSLNPVLYENAWLFKGFDTFGLALDRVNIYHTIIPVGVNILSLFIMYVAYAVYVNQRAVFPQHTMLFKFSYHQWYIDDIYHKLFVQPVMALGKFCFWFDRTVIDGFIHFLQHIAQWLSKVSAWTDKYIVDGFLHLLAAIVQSIGNFARGFQNGKVQYYLLSMLVVVLAFFIIKTLI